MKKIVLIAMLFFMFKGFASTNITPDPIGIEQQSKLTDNFLNEYHTMKRNILFIFVYKTTCGKTAVSFSYEWVNKEDYEQWRKDMEMFYCEEL